MVKKAKKTSLKNDSAGGNKQAKKNKFGFFNRAFTYLKEMKSELKKVVWPTRKKLFSSMLEVFTMVFIVAIIVVLSDFTFRRLLNALISSI